MMPAKGTRSRVVWSAACLALMACGCSSTYPRREPVGEVFPTVGGQALDGTPYSIPVDFAGKPVLLLIGFEMETQFDLDRWLLAVSEVGVDVKIYELPTIPGMIPGMFASKIDQGMRSGIPQEDWGGVITLYDDAAEVAEFVGNENPLPGRIVLLDRAGRVVFFHDDGFSVGALKRLREALAALDTSLHLPPSSALPLCSVISVTSGVNIFSFGE